MNVRWCVALAVLALFGCLAAPAEPVLAGGPHWVGAPQGSDKTWQCKKSVSIDQAVQTASLKMAADFCTAAVAINGQTVLTVEPYSPTQELDVTAHLRQGKNEIGIVA